MDADYALRRSVASTPTVVARLAFNLLYRAAGSPAAIIAGDRTTADDVGRIRRGLDRIARQGPARNAT